VAWDLRWPVLAPVRGGRPEGDDDEDSTPVARWCSGSYRVQLAQRVAGAITPLGEPQTFKVKPLSNTTLPAADRAALLAFHRQAADLQRAALGADRAVGRARRADQGLSAAIQVTPRADLALRQQAIDLQHRLDDVEAALSGDPIIGRHNEPTPPAILDRVNQIVQGWGSTSEPTATARRSYEIASSELGEVLPKIRSVASELEALEKKAEELGAPWTPGRIPTWQGTVSATRGTWFAPQQMEVGA
jgi:hypothetical protein